MAEGQPTWMENIPSTHLAWPLYRFLNFLLRRHGTTLFIFFLFSPHSTPTLYVDEKNLALNEADLI